MNPSYQMKSDQITSTENPKQAQQTQQTPKARFDNWEAVVDCNDCESYWNESCDGVSDGSTRLCRAFTARRKVNIPLQLKDQQMAIERLDRYSTRLNILLIMLALAHILHLIGHLIA